MAPFQFGDHYKAAGLAPGPDIILLRQAPFERLRQEVTPDRAVVLTRLYFGLPTIETPEWFRSAFAESDPSFSLIDNAREVAVLASGLLTAVMEAGTPAAAVAVLTAAAGGQRVPVVAPQLLEDARTTLRDSALRHAQGRTPAARPIALPAPAAGGATSTAATLAATPDWTRVGAAFTQAQEETRVLVQAVTEQANALVVPLVGRVVALEEEVDMLWWYVGGWSRVLERAFTELDHGLAAVMAGLDLAALTRHAPGPAAGPALLQRLITTGRKGKPAAVSVASAVNKLPPEAYVRLGLGPALDKVPDLCPALTGLRVAHEVGEAPAWYARYRKLTHLDPEAGFEPLALAVQVSREAMLVELLS